MAISVTTVGAKVLWAVETTAGTCPSTGFTELKGVNTAPEIALSIEALDCSDITDTITQYVDGRQDPGGEKQFVLNHRADEVSITNWNAMVTAYEALTGGKAVWIEYLYPAGSKAFFWRAIPRALGNNGINQNEADTIPASAICTDVGGWSTAISS